jgi:hypothetical protein
MRPVLIVTILVALAPGCRLSLRQSVSVDPAATFAAHKEHGGLGIDRLAPGRTGRLRAAGWVRLPGSPSLALESEGHTLADFWLSGDAVVTRRGPSETAPLVGTVTPSWEDGAVRLTIQPADGAAFRTDPFLRQETGGGTDRLTRVAETVIDVRGSYEAQLRDAGGRALGWLRVRIGPYLPAPRIYEAVTPPPLPPELAVAAAAALDAEVDWIEDHALNVYRGTNGGPLERSIPSHQ